MSPNPNCPEKSDLHSGAKTTLTLQRILDGLKTELQNEPAETEATKKFTEDLALIENEYNGIQEIVNAYEKKYQEFNGDLQNNAQQQGNSIAKWLNKNIDESVKKAIEDLRNGEFYAKQEENLKKKLDGAEEAYYALKEKCYEYCEAKENKAIEEFEKTKAYEKSVGDCFVEMEELFKKATDYNDGKKYRSLFAIQLEFNKIRKKTIIEKEGGELADPETFKNNLTNGLRKVIVCKHERYRWHKQYLAEEDIKKKDLTEAQSNFDKAKQNYEDHIKNQRDRFIREAEDTPPAVIDAGKTPAKEPVSKTESEAKKVTEK